MKSAMASLLLLVLALASCDDGVPGARSASCADLCAKLELCDDRTDEVGCQRACEAELVRSDLYLQARAECAMQSSCNVFAGEVGVMGEDLCDGLKTCHLNDCTGDAIARLMPTADERAYCESAVSKINACDSTQSLSVLGRHCLTLVPALSALYLREMNGCLQGDCAQLGACLDSVGDRYNTDLSLYPESSVRKQSRSL